MNYFEAASIRPDQMMPASVWGGAPANFMPSSTDVNRFISEGLIGPIADGVRQAFANLSDTIGGTQGTMRGGSYAYSRAPQRWKQWGPPRRDECCEPCGRYDPCHCNCCIVDADLVVYARLGETRVIPLCFENRWRRERQIKLDLSGWTTRGGHPAPIVARFLPPAPEFKLGPCATHCISLIIEAPFDRLTTGSQEGRKEPIDVDDCLVCYADCRVEGCDIRALRIAVALLPRDCGPYRVVCECDCCC
jgi:hypothetical protein